MNARQLKIASVCAAVALGVLVCSNAAVFAGDQKSAIDKVRVDFNAAFNEAGAQAIGKLLDANAVWYPPGRPSVAGRDQITAYYAERFKSVRPKFELKPGDIQSGDGWAFIAGDFIREDKPKAGGAVKKVSGHYLLVLKKQADGSWKIARDIWSDF